MGFYDERILPYCIELACGMKELAPERQKTTAALRGTVIEIGFGSGTNLPYLPATVEHLLAVDPSAKARQIGQKRIASAPCPIEYVGLDATRIDVADARADCALSTFTLCTVPDAAQALRELRRILKPGGKLFFLEHGRAPDPGVARWQDRLNGLQRAMCGGCNLDRDVPGLLRAAGFQVDSVDAGYFPKGPRTHSYLYRGAATA